MEIIKLDKGPLINWGGGTSQELYIHPNSSNFKNRNFDFRISTATVEIGSSDFTKIEGFLRNLTVIKGELKLVHGGYHESFLMPGSSDNFYGDWDTHSVGIASNFNIIYSPDYKVEVSVITDEYEITSNSEFNFIFCIDSCLINGNTFAEGDLVNLNSKMRIEIKPEDKVILVGIDSVEN